jgi:hypothetical protein
MQAPTSQLLLQPELMENPRNFVNPSSMYDSDYPINDNNQRASSIMIPKMVVETVMMPVSMSVPKPANFNQRNAGPPGPPGPQRNSVPLRNPGPSRNPVPPPQGRYNPVSFGPNLRGVSFHFQSLFEV